MVTSLVEDRIATRAGGVEIEKGAQCEAPLARPSVARGGLREPQRACDQIQHIFGNHSAVGPPALITAGAESGAPCPISAGH